MLRLEAEAIGNDPLMHMTPVDVSLLLCQNFSFQEYECLYLEKAPILFGLIRLFCSINNTMPPRPTQNIGDSLISHQEKILRPDAAYPSETSRRSGRNPARYSPFGQRLSAHMPHRTRPARAYAY